MAKLAGGMPQDVRPLEAERIVLAVNPNATNADIARQVQYDLEGGGLGLPVVAEATRPGGVGPNQDYFGSLIREGDVVVTVSGDGGFREVGSAFLLPELQRIAGNVALTNVGGGNASDIFWSLHGTSKASPTEMLQRGLTVPVRPLAWEAEDEGGIVRNRIAFSYIGHGKSAVVGARQVNSGDYRRRSRLRGELALAGELLLDEHAFVVRWLDGENGAENNLSELTITAGSRMARYGHLLSRHWNDTFFVMRAGEGMLDTAVGLARLAAGIPFGTLTNEDVTFMALTDTEVQFDGEGPESVPEGTIITAGRHPSHVRFMYSPHMLPRPTRY